MNRRDFHLICLLILAAALGACQPAKPICVAMIGDSVPAGDAPVELPGVDFWRVYGYPISKYAQDEVTAKHELHITILDRTHAAATISSGLREPYQTTIEYQHLKTDACNVFAIFPWINDLNQETPSAQAAETHAAALAALSAELLHDHAGAHILIFNYYPLQPKTWTTDYTEFIQPDTIALFNEAIKASCDQGGLHHAQIACYDTLQIFDGMGSSYLADDMDRAELEGNLLVPLNETQQQALDYFSRISTDGKIIGDGVHLSVAGRKRLAVFVLQVVRGLA
jgi:lysophospholipase L1-like esterase